MDDVNLINLIIRLFGSVFDDPSSRISPKSAYMMPSIVDRI